MNEMNVTLRLMQYTFMVMIVVVIAWIALWVGIAALVLWALVHVLTTDRTAATTATGEHIADHSEAGPRAQREPTNWPAVLAALVAAGAGTFSILQTTSWFGIGAGVAAAVIAIYAIATTDDPSTGTKNAMMGTVALGAVIAFFGLFNLWLDAPVTLYGENWGESRGAYTTIEDYQADLVCLDQPVSPADPEQELFTVDTSGFTATSSCRISDDEDAQDAVFVQASNAAELDALFASGVLSAGKLHDQDLWVERDGAVAVITADEASEELSQDSGTTWISLDEERP